MATRKKLIQLSKTANILSSYNYVLFVQSASNKKTIQLGLKNVANVRIFKCKNNTVQKAISQMLAVRFFSLEKISKHSNCLISERNNKQQLNKQSLQKGYKENLELNLNNSTIIDSRDKIKTSEQFYNVFQGPNCIIAGNDLQQLPLVWNFLNKMPHSFFCGAILEQVVANHLDLEKAVSHVYNVPREIVYSRFLATLNPIENLSSILNTKTYSLISTLSNMSTDNSK
jgi:hypothetical protein